MIFNFVTTQTKPCVPAEYFIKIENENLQNAREKLRIFMYLPKKIKN